MERLTCRLSETEVTLHAGESNYAAIQRLAAYEDTGLTPEEVDDLMSVREISPEAEYAINKHADDLIARLDAIIKVTDDKTIDVVRCKDCKYFEKDPYVPSDRYWLCQRRKAMRMEPDDFCSYGERVKI